MEAHNLTSQKFSLKLFTETNFYKAQNGFQSFKIVEKQNSEGADLQSGSVLSQVKSMSEFHRAFFWAAKLRRKVFPLDESFDALFYFLIESDFFEAPCNGDGYGRGSFTQAAFCANFCDYVIRKDLNLTFYVLCLMLNIYVLRFFWVYTLFLLFSMLMKIFLCLSFPFIFFFNYILIISFRILFCSFLFTKIMLITSCLSSYKY